MKELPAILTIEQALEAQSFVIPTKRLARGDAAAAIAAAPKQLKGTVRTGQQEQFYLEGHITYAVPREDGQLTLYVSTQHPDGNQREAAAALNLGTHDVEVICRRMGGGFGGKEGNASIFSQSAAHSRPSSCKRPVKLRVNRDDDMTITGKRHDFRIDYDRGLRRARPHPGPGRDAGQPLRLQRRLLRPGERPRGAAHRQLLPPAAPAGGEPTAAAPTPKAAPRSAVSAARRACSASRP